MKNLAKATAPAALSIVAKTGITGGASPAWRRFGPVVGTSAGTVGAAWMVSDGLGGMDDDAAEEDSELTAVDGVLPADDGGDALDVWPPHAVASAIVIAMPSAQLRRRAWFMKPSRTP